MIQPAMRRRSILDAALASFLEKGFAATSIADIRARSGASTGSIYHFFTGKGALAEALLRQAATDWGTAATAALDSAASPRQAIEGAVSGLVIWGLANPDHARFMDEIRTLAHADAEFAPVRQLLEQGHAASAARYAQMAASGAVRDLPWPVAHSLMLGPAYNYLRLAPPTPAPAARPIAALFAAAAWQAVRT